MKTNKLVVLILCIAMLSSGNFSMAQNVSAILDLSSTSQGFLPPRMTTTARDSIEIPAEGMMLYNQTTGYFNYYDGQTETWIELRPAQPELDITVYFANLPQGIQMLLDIGETPANLLSLGISPNKIIGNFYAGGLIFYLDSLGRGLVVSPEDQSTSEAWGCDGIPVDGADGTAVGTGFQNSLDIESSCKDQSSAKLCLNLSFNGFRDWYLPSKEELNLIWEELADSDGDGNNSGPTDPNNIGNFERAAYWSSSEADDTQAHFQSFSSGFQNTDGKDSFHSIRAVRSF